MWERYEVRLRFTGRLCGSVPLHKELIKDWVTARAPKNKPDDGPSLDDIQAEVEQTIEETVEEAEERVTLGFQSDDKGLFLRGGTVKAHLKDCSNQVKDAPGVGVKALKAKLANRVFVEQDRVYICTGGGDIVQAHTGEFEQPVHVMTARGPRSALKRIQYVTDVFLNFTLKVLVNKEVTEDILQSVFEYGEIHGYGGERGMGEGRYRVEKFTKEAEA